MSQISEVPLADAAAFRGGTGTLVVPAHGRDVYVCDNRHDVYRTLRSEDGDGGVDGGRWFEDPGLGAFVQGVRAGALATLDGRRFVQTAAPPRIAAMPFPDEAAMYQNERGRVYYTRTGGAATLLAGNGPAMQPVPEPQLLDFGPEVYVSGDGCILVLAADGARWCGHRAEPIELPRRGNEVGLNALVAGAPESLDLLKEAFAAFHTRTLGGDVVAFFRTPTSRTPAAIADFGEPYVHFFPKEPDRQSTVWNHPDIAALRSLGTPIVDEPEPIAEEPEPVGRVRRVLRWLRRDNDRH
jgi:hypothetical protein